MHTTCHEMLKVSTMHTLTRTHTVVPFVLCADLTTDVRRGLIHTKTHRHTHTHNVITVLLQCCYSVVTVLLQWYRLSCVLISLLMSAVGSYTQTHTDTHIHTMLSQCCCSVVTVLLQWYRLSCVLISLLISAVGSYRITNQNITSATCCYRVVTVLSQCCYCVVIVSLARTSRLQPVR
jgi:uncharacterized membrane protein YhdT